MASGDNRAIVGSGYLASQLVGNGLALTLLIFGVVALLVYLTNSSARALALGAMVLSMVGIALLLAGLGVLAYAVSALSMQYLNGNPERRILDHIFAGPFGSMLILTFLLYSAQFVLFSVAVWRSGTLPTWAGVLLAIHAPLISGHFSVAGSVLRALLAVVGSGWIATSALRQPFAQAGIQPRAR